MKNNKIKVAIRHEKGKGAARSLRREGIIPAVLYGYETENLLLSVSESELLKLLGDSGGRRMLLELEIEGDEHDTKKVLIKEIQHDVIKLTPIHVDFLVLDEKQKMVLEVPLIFSGEPVGVKNGGVLQYHIDEVKVECLPHDIPEEIMVDVSNLGLGDSMYLKDLKAGSNYSFVGEEKLLVASVEHPAIQEELESEREIEEEETVMASEEKTEEVKKVKS